MAVKITADIFTRYSNFLTYLFSDGHRYNFNVSMSNKKTTKYLKIQYKTRLQNRDNLRALLSKIFLHETEILAT